jgi:hypothetical protein
VDSVAFVLGEATVSSLKNDMYTTNRNKIFNRITSINPIPKVSRRLTERKIENECDCRANYDDLSVLFKHFCVISSLLNDTKTTTDSTNQTKGEQKKDLFFCLFENMLDEFFLFSAGVIGKHEISEISGEQTVDRHHHNLFVSSFAFQIGQGSDQWNAFVNIFALPDVP